MIYLTAFALILVAQTEGQNIEPPKNIKAVGAVVPDSIWVEDTITLSVLVDTNGHVQDVKIESFIPLEIEKNIREAAFAMEFEPAHDSLLRPVSMWTDVKMAVSGMPNLSIRSAEGLEGEVVVEIQVSPSGHVLGAYVLKSSDFRLEAEALDAAMAMQFPPSDKERWFVIIYRFVNPPSDSLSSSTNTEHLH